jgi:hypothetical protein
MERVDRVDRPDGGDCGVQWRFAPATTYLLISRVSRCIAHSINIKLTAARAAKHCTLLGHAAAGRQLLRKRLRPPKNCQQTLSANYN